MKPANAHDAHGMILKISIIKNMALRSQNIRISNENYCTR